MTDCLGVALAYHAAGLCVIPARRADKRPALPSWEKYQHERPDEKQIRFWFAGDSNIAIVCGAVSGGLVVADFDSQDAFATWASEHPDIIAAAPIVKTSRGRHVHVRSANGAKSCKLPGIDVKAEGGYVLAPPSVHPSGTRYELVSGDFGRIPVVDLSTVGLAPKPTPESPGHSRSAPNGDGTPYARAALRDEIARVVTASSGERNDSLNRAAFNLGQLVGGGALDRAEVEVALSAAARGAGLSEGEIGPTIASGINKGMEHPRQIPARAAAAGAPHWAEEPHPPDWTEDGPATDEPDDAPEPGGEGDTRPDGRQVLTAAELLQLQSGPVDWLLTDLIPADGLAILAGAPGTGKTFLSLDLALGVSSGGRTWGRDARPGACLYVDAENSPRLLAQRLRGLLEGRRLSPPDGLHFLPGANLSLTKPNDVAFLGAAIAQSGARLVILDSLVRFLGGADENDASHVSMAMGELRRLANAHGCAVLLLHHLRKSGALSVGTILESVRGSGDLVAAVDTVLVLRGADGSGNITAAKSRWIETPAPFGFSIATTGGGISITTGEPTGAGKKLIEQVIEALTDILSESKAPLSRKEIDALLEGRGLESGERTVDTALATLRHAGRVTVARIGRANTYQLAGQK